MKREGKKHGMVRSLNILPPPLNPTPNSKIVNLFDSPPTAGIHTKVLSKPTNHSKYTGKCRKARCAGCHYHPISKSREKGKGRYKLKSCDVVLNHRLVSWRVVDKGYGFNYTGISASGIVGHLSGNCWDEGEEEDDDDGVEDDLEVGYGDPFNESIDLAIECIAAKEEEITAIECIAENEEEITTSGVQVDEDGDMGFYKVEIILEYLDEEGWYVVEM